MTNNTMTISPKYQVVIPREVRKIIKIKPNEKVSVDVGEDGQSIVIRPAIKNWAKHMRGLGKEIWQKIDVEKYIKEERDAWERKI